MDAIKKSLIDKAVKKHKRIYPVSTGRTLNDCFTDEGDQLIFWFNIKGGSTKILTHKFTESERE